MARKGLTWDGGFSAHFSLKSEAERAAPISRLTAKAEWSSAPAAWLGTRVHIQKMRKEKANGNFVKRCNLFFLPLGAETLPPKVQVRTWEPGEEGHCAAPDTGAPLALESATPASTGSAPAPARSLLPGHRGGALRTCPVQLGRGKGTPSRPSPQLIDGPPKRHAIKKQDGSVAGCLGSDPASPVFLT